MSFIGNMFGGGGSAQGPSQASVDAAGKSVQDQLAQQQAFVQQMQAQGGLQNQSNVFQQQQQLAQQLQQQTLGQGPNPAQAQLAQNTASNTAQQSALAAGQRGSSANAGLTARNAANQGANMQQQATGQAATMQAQQQIAAQQQLGQQQQNMAGLATNQVGQLQQGQQMAGNTAIQNQSSLLGAQSSANQVNAQADAQRNSAVMGLIGGVGAAAMTGGASLAPAAAGAAAGAGSSRGPGPTRQAFANGGQVQQERLQTAGDASRLDNGFGKVIVKKADGGKVPGKAAVAGDSLKNDKVKALLSPGELIIPRTVVQGGPEAIMRFAQQCLEEDNG